MPELSDWLPSTLVGLTFASLGIAKFYGFARGIDGGRCKPTRDRVCGSCPSWSREINIGVAVLLLVLGFGNLGYAVWLFAQSRS